VGETAGQDQTIFSLTQMVNQEGKTALIKAV
jgi:hypothetical protein